MSVDRVRKVEGGLREGVEVEGEGCGYKVGVVIKGTDQSKRSSTRRRSAKAWRGAEVGRVLAVQKPVLACSSVTGSFGLCGRGKPASVGGGVWIGSRTRSAKRMQRVGAVRDGSTLQMSAECRAGGSELR